ncbi:hypothetical protein B0H14DRAFT_3151335, partial [Mycena olivaceomarginata]
MLQRNRHPPHEDELQSDQSNGSHMPPSPFAFTANIVPMDNLWYAPGKGMIQGRTSMLTTPSQQAERLALNSTTQSEYLNPRIAARASSGGREFPIWSNHKLCVSNPHPRNLVFVPRSPMGFGQDSARVVLLICGLSLVLELRQAPSTGLLYFRAISNSAIKHEHLMNTSLGVNPNLNGVLLVDFLNTQCQDTCSITIPKFL